MTINVRPAAAEEWAADDFASAHMHQRENGQLQARKLQNEITQHQSLRDLLVQLLCRLFAYRLTLLINLELVSPDVN